jgi:hypothetical protein
MTVWVPHLQSETRKYCSGDAKLKQALLLQVDKNLPLSNLKQLVFDCTSGVDLELLLAEATQLRSFAVKSKQESLVVIKQLATQLGATRPLSNSRSMTLYVDQTVSGIDFILAQIDADFNQQGVAVHFGLETKFIDQRIRIGEL